MKGENANLSISKESPQAKDLSGYKGLLIPLVKGRISR